MLIQKSNPIDQILGNRYRDFSNRYFSLTIQSISTIENFIDFSSIFLSIFLDNLIDISLYFHRYFSIFSSIFLDIFLDNSIDISRHFIAFYLLFEKLFHCSLTILSSFPQGCKSYLMISFQSTIHPIFIDFSSVFLSIFLDIFIDISR